MRFLLRGRRGQAQVVGVRDASSDHMNLNFRTPFLASMSGTDFWLLVKQETGDPDSPPIRMIVASIPRRTIQAA